MLTQIVKKVSGTAGEALEVRALNSMKARYRDPHVVAAIIEDELRTAGETMETVDIYLRVKTKIQNNEISFVRAEREAKQHAKNVLDELGVTSA